MISKKALLIAVGMVVAMPGTSHAETLMEKQKRMMVEMMETLQQAGEQELEAAHQKTKETEEAAQKAEETLNARNSDLEEELKNATLARKNELLAKWNGVLAARQAQLKANNAKVANYRAQNKELLEKYGKRVTIINDVVASLMKVFSLETTNTPPTTLKSKMI